MTEAGEPQTEVAETGEESTTEQGSGEGNKKPEGESAAAPVVSASKRSRPAYKYDPDKITLRFLFANRDGLTVTVECTPTSTVGEVKGALLSVWPDGKHGTLFWCENALLESFLTCTESLLVLPNCSAADRIRMICMGKGMLMPDTRTLEDCQVPVFKTHPTPINVSVKPENVEKWAKGGSDEKGGRRPLGGAGPPGSEQTTTGCVCVIL